MKFTVTMKCPDALDVAIDEASFDEERPDGLDDEEWGDVVDGRKEKSRAAARRWFQYGEYLTVEVDTDAQTCTVVPVR